MTKYQKEVKRIIYKAEIALLTKEKNALMTELKKNAGTIAVLNKDKETLEKTLKAQIASTSNMLEAQAKSNKRINIAWFLMTIVGFVIGLWLGIF